MTSPTTLRPGSTGGDVQTLQRRLTTAGYPLTVDGWYGAATERAVRAFQLAHNLVADGIAGQRTQLLLIGGRAGSRDLTEADIQRAAVALGCESAAIHAVIEVESGKSGFLPDGRVLILFERHVFWRQLVAAGIDPSTAGLPDYILSQQRGGYLGATAEYVRLARAAAISPLAAYASCSWGRFQIMGYHYKSLGYTSAEAMAEAFARSEGEQLAAFGCFVQQDDALLKALRGKKWAAFAKLYNGPAYAANSYDARLAAAYARHHAAVDAVAA